MPEIRLHFPPFGTWFGFRPLNTLDTVWKRSEFWLKIEKVNMPCLKMEVSADFLNI